MATQSPDRTNPVEHALRHSGSSFLETLSREVDTALASIVERAEQLRDNPSEVGRLGMRIQKQGEQLQEVFRSLTRLASLEQNSDELGSESVDVVGLTEKLLASHEQSARDQGLGLGLEVPERPIEVTTNPEGLRRALRHLLSTAIACAEDGELTLRVDPLEEEIGFHIEDTGDVLCSDALLQAFEAFPQRASEGQSGPERTGIGLGPLLAQAFARRLDGAIEVEDHSEAGPVVTLQIPHRVSATQSPGAPAPDETPEETDGGARLLVLEDNEVTQKLLHRMLKGDYQVDLVSQSTEALQKVKQVPYDVLILDINLGERRTGVEVLHEVREMEQYASIPAVACTAYALDGHREQFLQVGFNDVVTKPVTKRELLEAIDCLLEDPSLPESDGIEEIKTEVDLPPFSSTLIQITDLISQSSDSHDIEALTRVLEKDQVISFWLLRHINSAYYGINKSVETVERAVRYLGFRPVCNLVLTKVMARNSFDKEGAGAQAIQQYIMKTSSMAAFTAREIAERFEFGAPKQAYTAGLVAQLGRLALLSTEGKTYVNLWFEGQERTEEAFQGPPPWGQEILHCEANYLQKGVAVGKACSLSDELLSVLQWHPHPRQAGAWVQSLVTIVALALEVAYLGYDPERESWDEAALIEELQDSEVVSFLTEQGSHSREELTYAMRGITEEGREYVSTVLSNT